MSVSCKHLLTVHLPLSLHKPSDSEREKNIEAAAELIKNLLIGHLCLFKLNVRFCFTSLNFLAGL